MATILLAILLIFGGLIGAVLIARFHVGTWELPFLCAVILLQLIAFGRGRIVVQKPTTPA